jgi:hypothetical protein
MYKLFVFRRLLHYGVGRAIDTSDFPAVLAFGATSASSARDSRPGFLTLYSVSLPAEFFFLQKRIF